MSGSPIATAAPVKGRKKRIAPVAAAAAAVVSEMDSAEGKWYVRFWLLEEGSDRVTGYPLKKSETPF